MAVKLTRLTHKIATQLHLVAESCTICNSRSRRPVRELLDTFRCSSGERPVTRCTGAFRKLLSSKTWFLHYFPRFIHSICFKNRLSLCIKDVVWGVVGALATFSRNGMTFAFHANGSLVKGAPYIYDGVRC
jgi:hypothetical protein